MKKGRPKVQILLSGGLDSSALVAFYKRLKYPCSGVYIDYGQLAREEEARASSRIARHFKISRSKIAVSGIGKGAKGYVFGRNMLLFSLALSKCSNFRGLIALGIHRGSNYPDCDSEFVVQCQRVADIYSGGKIQVSAPFVEWTKDEIFQFSMQENVPVKKTYSCEAGKKPSCGRCKSCLDRSGVLA